MQRTINGIVPKSFAVYYRKDNTTFLVNQDEISMDNFSEYEDIKRIELYLNGTENTAPEMIDRLDKAP